MALVLENSCCFKNKTEQLALLFFLTPCMIFCDFHHLISIICNLPCIDFGLWVSWLRLCFGTCSLSSPCTQTVLQTSSNILQQCPRHALFWIRPNVKMPFPSSDSVLSSTLSTAVDGCLVHFLEQPCQFLLLASPPQVFLFVGSDAFNCCTFLSHIYFLAGTQDGKIYQLDVRNTRWVALNSISGMAPAASFPSCSSYVHHGRAHVGSYVGPSSPLSQTRILTHLLHRVSCCAIQMGFFFLLFLVLQCKLFIDQEHQCFLYYLTKMGSLPAKVVLWFYISTILLVKIMFIQLVVQIPFAVVFIINFHNKIKNLWKQQSTVKQGIIKYFSLYLLSFLSSPLRGKSLFSWIKSFTTQGFPSDLQTLCMWLLSIWQACLGKEMSMSSPCVRCEELQFPKQWILNLMDFDVTEFGNIGHALLSCIAAAVEGGLWSR